MKKTLLTIRPSIVNAIAPIYIKIVFALLPLALLLGIAAFILTNMNVIDFSFNQLLWLILIIFFIISLLPLFIRIIILRNTAYYFYHTHVVYEFKFITIKRSSVPYNQIVNVRTKISLWDRICRSGDVILHTAENNAPDLVLRYVRYPHKIENVIFQLINRYKQRLK